MSTQLYDKNKTPIYPITDIESVAGLSAKLGEIKTELEGKVSFSKDELKNEIFNEVEKNLEDLDLTSQYKSTVFIRVFNKPASPEGGNWDSPIPTKDAKDYTTGNTLTDVFGNSLRWSDGIPDGELPLWASTCIFSTDESKNGTWTEPRKMTDTSSFDVDFSSVVTNPGNPTDNPDNWSNESGEDTIWMATRTKSNGVWEDWQISKIKGEDGKDGTSINIKGTLESEDNLPEKPTNDSDSYLIGGELWVWDGDSWVNVGNIKGEKGDSYYIHIKYANKATGAEEIIFNALGIQLTPTESNGETPGNYIGTKVDNKDKDDTEWESYTWARWKGEDGFGYEYIYTLSNTAPTIPTQQKNSNGDEFVNNDFVPDDWADNPLDPKKDGDEALHCWICTRQKVDGVWQSFRGNPNEEYKNQAALYSRYVEDGLPGESALTMNFLEDSITVPCYSDGTLIPGNHFGTGNGQNFTTAYELNFDQGYTTQNVFVYYGTKEVTSEMTFSIAESNGLNCILSQSEFTYVDIMGFDETNPRSGSLILKAEHSDYGSISLRFFVNKVYSGKDGTFTYYQLKPSINQIVITDNDLTKIEPATFDIYVNKITETGKEQLSLLDGYYSEVRWMKNDSDQITGFGPTMNGETNLNIPTNKYPNSDVLLPDVPSYLLIQLKKESEIIDFERIPVLLQWSQVSTNIPSWVTEWDGTSAQFNGKNVLAAQAYVGDKPTEGTPWTGLLMGSDIASLENWPYDDDNDSTTTYNFSGIVAVKNFDSSQGDNIVGENNADVTFALDSRTGDAYLKGEVHATSGTFSGELKAATGTFSGELTAASGSFSGELTAATGNIKNVTAENLTINEGTINSTGTATDGSEFTVQIGGEILQAPNLACLQHNEGNYYFRLGGLVDGEDLCALSMGTGSVLDGNYEPYFEVKYDPSTYTSYLDLYGSVDVNEIRYRSYVSITGSRIAISNKTTSNTYSAAEIDGIGFKVQLPTDVLPDSIKNTGGTYYSKLDITGVVIPNIALSNPGIFGALYVDSTGVVRVSGGSYTDYLKGN